MRKGKEPLLDLHNEIKIITSSDKTFDLWKELVIKYSQRELLDVDATPICKMRLNPKWTPHRDGILSREFFKWLRNYDEEDHKKLILHILGLLATNKSALLFLTRKSEKAKFNIPATFQAPETPVYSKPRKYQELQYRIQAMELRMEFYLHLFELFCRTIDTVYSVFNGTKILCASLVSGDHTLI